MDDLILPLCTIRDAFESPDNLYIMPLTVEQGWGRQVKQFYAILFIIPMNRDLTEFQVHAMRQGEIYITWVEADAVVYCVNESDFDRAAGIR